MVRRFAPLSWWFFLCGAPPNAGSTMVDDDGELAAVDGPAEYPWLGI